MNNHNSDEDLEKIETPKQSTHSRQKQKTEDSQVNDDLTAEPWSGLIPGSFE